MSIGIYRQEQQANLDNKILSKRISVQAYSAAVFFFFWTEEGRAICEA